MCRSPLHYVLFIDLSFEFGHVHMLHDFFPIDDPFLIDTYTPDIVNVNRPKSFLDAAQREKMREREARESGLMFSRDRLIEMIPVSY